MSLDETRELNDPVLGMKEYFAAFLKVFAKQRYTQAQQWTLDNI